jgi:hypothetical protein
MTSLLKFALGGAAAVALMAGANAASAASLIVGGYTLEEGSFGGPLGVHSTGSQSPANTVYGVVNNDGSGVTFTSSGLLSITGGGEATITNDTTMNDLNVSFAKAWDNITFYLQAEKGKNAVDSQFTLLVNGTALFQGPACSFCVATGGGSKFTISGQGINNLAFTFTPGIDTAKQFRVEGLGSPVPEPATWAMMIGGFSLAGVALRRRRMIAAFA